MIGRHKAADLRFVLRDNGGAFFRGWVVRVRGSEERGLGLGHDLTYFTYTTSILRYTYRDGEAWW
jgi:hypothetical protein